jgi:hypothetical protein
MTGCTKSAAGQTLQLSLSYRESYKRVVDKEKYRWRCDSRVYTHQARHAKGLKADLRAAVTIANSTKSTTYFSSALPASLLV